MNSCGLKFTILLHTESPSRANPSSQTLWKALRQKDADWRAQRRQQTYFDSFHLDPAFATTSLPQPRDQCSGVKGLEESEEKGH